MEKAGTYSLLYSAGLITLHVRIIYGQLGNSSKYTNHSDPSSGNCPFIRVLLACSYYSTDLHEIQRGIHTPLPKSQLLIIFIFIIFTSRAEHDFLDGNPKPVLVLENVKKKMTLKAGK